jgi:hypothetical protein
VEEEEQNAQKPEVNESPKKSKETKEENVVENQGDEVALPKNDQEDIEEEEKEATSQTESEAIETTQLPESKEAEETSPTVDSLTTQATTVKHRRRKVNSYLMYLATNKHSSCLYFMVTRPKKVCVLQRKRVQGDEHVLHTYAHIYYGHS